MKSDRSLLMRYLFPVGMVREPRGDLFLQHATFVTNVGALRRWLPHYARVHATLGAGLVASSVVLADCAASPWLLVPTSAAAALEVCLAVVFTAGAVALRLR